MIYPTQTQTCTRQMWEPHSPPMLPTPDGTSRARSALSLILLLGTWLSGKTMRGRFPGAGAVNGSDGPGTKGPPGASVLGGGNMVSPCFT